MNRFLSNLLLCLLCGVFWSDVSAQCQAAWATHIKTVPSGGLGSGQPELLTSTDGSLFCIAQLVMADSLWIGNVEIAVPNSTPSNPAIIIIKLSSQGQYVWHTVISSNGITSLVDTELDDSGNVFVSGTQHGGLEVQGTIIPGVSNENRFFILKFNPAGQVDWYRTSNIGRSSCPAIVMQNNELWFAVGFSDSVRIDGQAFYSGMQTVPGSFDMVVGKLDDFGNLLSQTVIGGMGSVAVREMDCNATGCLLQGRFDEEMTIDGQQLTTPVSGHYSFFQLYLDNDYSLEWSNVSTNSSSLFSWANGLSWDDDYFYTSGYYDGAFSFDGISVPQSNSRALFSLKTSAANGNVEWLRSMDGNAFDGSESNDNLYGNLVIGGTFSSGEIDIGGEIKVNSEVGSDDSFIASYDKNGNLRCVKSIEGSGAQTLRSLSYLQDGYIASLINFGGPTIIDGVEYDPNGYDILIWKTCLPCDTITTTTPIKQSPNFTLSPNPFTTQTTLQWQQNLQNGSIKLYDLTGRKLREEKVNGSRHTLQRNWLAAGVYVLGLYEGGEFLGAVRVVVGNGE